MHRYALPGWAIERSQLMNRFPPPDPRRTALLVIDMQQAFVAPDAAFGNPHALDTMPNINRLVRAMRAGGARICWSRQTAVIDGPGRLPDWQLFEGSLPSLSQDSLAPGSPGREIHRALEVDPADLLFDKYRFSCFVNAAIDLDAWLRAEGIDTVVVVGTVTNCCCESTARDASIRDYQVYFVADATAAVTDEEHQAALLNIDAIIGRVVTTEEMLELVRAPQPAPSAFEIQPGGA